MKTFLLSLSIITLAVVCIAAPPPGSNIPVTIDPSGNYLPLTRNGHAPNLPVNTTVNGHPIGDGTGTVTSITATSPISVSPNPITTTGTISFLNNVDLGMTAAQLITITDAATTSTATVLTLSHQTSGTADVGFGGQLQFRLQDTSGSASAGGIATVWTNPNHGSNAADMVFKLTTNGSTLPTTATLHSDGFFDVTAGYKINGTSIGSPSALTKTNDTNVTLTLGGTPTTALLQSVSITAGWTGTLAVSRGGFGKAMTDPNADQLVAWDDTDGDFEYVNVGTGLSYTHSSHTLAATAQAQSHAITFVVDGAGIVLGTGTKNPVKIPFGGTLTGWLLVAKPSGSVTVDILRAADGAGLPVTSIVGGGGTKPSLSSAVENSSTSFTSWTSTTLTAKDNLAISLSGVSVSTYCALTLYYQ
jgi:hypothetical protein